MVGRRKHLRVKGNSTISWNIEQGPSGHAEVSDLSVSGVQFIVDKSFNIPEGSIISIEGSEEGRLHGKRKIQLKWIKKIVQEERDCVLCGGDFI